MAVLLMIADDMTGALDSGVMLSERNINTEVLISHDADLAASLREHEAVVVNTETRHLSGREAYDTVRSLARSAKQLGVPYIYKKTDSALRGNVGAEIDAVQSATGEKTVFFAPAFPQQNRATVGGVQYVDGVPLDRSQFARDPLNPTVRSYVPDIIAQGSSLPVITSSREDCLKQPHIRLYDAVTEKDLAAAADEAIEKYKGATFAGCAGFIGELAKLLPLKKTECGAAEVSGPLMVFCGSMHELSKVQLEAAQRSGAKRYETESRKMISKGYWGEGEGKALMEKLRAELSSGNTFLFNPISERNGESYPGEKLEISRKLPGAIAELICDVIRGAKSGTPMIIGGDTLGAFLTQLGAKSVRPISQLRPGVVLAEVKSGAGSVKFVTKAGSFGDTQLIVELMDMVKQTQNI